jgi:hypothetical protein
MITEFVEAMSRLDFRKVEKFNDKYGSDLNKYLVRFENYCDNNFKGDRVWWIGELEKSLTGKMFEAFKVMRDRDDTYEAVKEKLLIWFKNSKDLRKKKDRDRFRNMQYNMGESLYLYSSRLEKQYKVAFPKHTVQTSKSLQDRFVTSLPKKIKEQVKSQIMGYKIGNKKVLWEIIQKWAQCFDVEKDKEKEDSSVVEVDSDEEIVINIGSNKQLGKVEELKPRVCVSERHVPGAVGAEIANGPNPNFGNVRAQIVPRYANNYYPVRPPMQFNFPQQAPRQFYNRNRYSYAQDNRFPGPPPWFRQRFNVRCTYCERIGHIIEFCRSKYKLCYACGGTDHFYRDCQRNLDSQPQSRNRSNSFPSSGQFQGNNSDRAQQYNRRNSGTQPIPRNFGNLN